MNPHYSVKKFFPFLVFILAFITSFYITSHLFVSRSPLSPLAKSSSSSSPIQSKQSNEPKTAPCPLNGAYYTNSQQQIWQKRRPLFVMIENHKEARPQSGLSQADIIYEAVAEGGITRFGAVYYCQVANSDVVLGPVRSARIYFINWASEYNYPLYVHVGGANCSPVNANNPSSCKSDPRVQALELLDKFGWVGSQGNDMNQFSIGYPTFWRDYNRLGHTVATEHTMYTSTDKLYHYAASKRGWTNLSPQGENWLDNFRSWSFKDDSPVNQPVSQFSFSFWQGYKDFDVVWKYDAQTNTYLRFNGGQPHLDNNNKQQIRAKVVVVQFVKEEGPVDVLKHMYYHNIGSGKALIFQDGQVIQATWSKPSRTARTIFKDSQGKEIVFNRGLIFIEALPIGNQVNY